MNENNNVAFAVCATGERYVKYRNNLVASLRSYFQGVPIVEIKPDDASLIRAVKSDADDIALMRLSIPVLPAFKDYTRVVYLDVDTDISSNAFSDILQVQTSEDGIAAVPDADQDMRIAYMSKRFPHWNKETFFNAGVVVFDLNKIDAEKWRSRIVGLLYAHAQNPYQNLERDILNAAFDIHRIDARFNWIWSRGADANVSAWLIHYAGAWGHAELDDILSMRSEIKTDMRTWKDRCVVVSPRHAFIRPWIRAYFATGNTTPLVIVPGPPGDWRDDDADYCQKAAAFSGGIVFDCSDEWKGSQRLAERAVRKRNVGWFTKKSILHAVATRLAPKEWAWIDDDAEVTGSLDECFDAAHRAPGFIFTQFYRPNSIDNQHPELSDIQHPKSMYRSRIDTGDKICWNSLVFFHGEANKRISEELGKDFPVEDDEIIFGHLYQHNALWHDGFCDFSIRQWQVNCKLASQIPRSWHGKIIHYTTNKNNGEVKKIWAGKTDVFPPTPFERVMKEQKKAEVSSACDRNTDEAIDAVFIIGTGSIDNNEELRYALRNLEQNCSFIRNVYICGFCPPWVDRASVRHLQWPDRFSHAKDANIIDKLRHACEQPGIAKRILFCSDDQFQTRPCTWDDFSPRYLRRYAANDGWYEGKKRVWHTRLRHTLERDAQRRRAAGMNANDVFYYQPHIWMQIDRDRFIDYARWCGYEQRDDTIIASGYFNFINADGRPDFDHAFLGGNTKDVPKTTHIAYHDGSYHAAMTMLKTLFPNPSRFETQGATETSMRKIQNPLFVPVSEQNENALDKNDPSPARPDESAELLDISARIRNTPIWNSLLGEVSRAEELRLFGVRGWRIVWRDLIVRWRSETHDGKDLQPITSARTQEASDVINRYMNNPNALRTIRFGSVASDIKRPSVWFAGRQLPRPATASERTSLHARVRNVLR